MLPFTQYKNLEYVRHFIHTLTNYTFATSAIVCNYYNIDVSQTKTFEGQVQTAPSETHNNLVFNLYVLQPIFNVTPQPYHLTSENNTVLQMNSSSIEAFLLFSDAKKFEPVLGDRIAFSVDLPILLKRKSSVLFKVVGIEVIQRDFYPLYKLTLEKDKTLASEEDLAVNEVYGFVPIVNKYLKFTNFVEALKIIDALRNTKLSNFCKDLNACIFNSDQIFYCAKVYLNLLDPVSKRVIANLLHANYYDRVPEYFSQQCTNSTKLRLYKTSDLRLHLYLSKVPDCTNYPRSFVCVPDINQNEKLQNDRTWYRLRLATSIVSTFHQLSQLTFIEFDLQERLKALDKLTIDELLNIVEREKSIQSSLASFVLVKKLLQLK